MLLEIVSSDDDVVVVVGIGVSCLLQSCMNDLDYIDDDITRKHITKFNEREVQEQERGMGWDG